MATTRRHQSVEQAERQANKPGHKTPEASQGPATRLLALQQTVGNAAVSRLIAGSRSLNRAADAPGGNRAADDAPGGGQDATLSMMRVAWDTGVTQRERDAAKKLEKPGARKGDFENASDQLVEAAAAAQQIGDQIGAVDATGRVKAILVANTVGEVSNWVSQLITPKTPAEIGEHIETGVIPVSDAVIAQISAASTSAAPGAAPPAPVPSAPTPASPAPTPGGSGPP
jgi:hypothetical protein